MDEATAQCEIDPEVPAARETRPGASARPRVVGKFLYAGERKLFLRGVTYGPFRPEPDGSEYHDEERAVRDLERMARNNINTFRTYTLPPRWLLDAAARHGLYVLVGLPWEQHVAFLGDQKLPRRIEDRVREGVASCAGHPAVLGFAIGNEVPSSVVRWHGHASVERHIERLYNLAKREDADALVTYVNYPSTEYLDLPFLDFCSFNVYLESPTAYKTYLARLQNIAGDKPLVIGETGLDSRRHGPARQAAAIDWQIRSSFASGCAGLYVFAWTDEWHRGGMDILDWDFGVVQRDRSTKPALSAVREAFASVPFAPATWPSFSVIVCTHRGHRTLRDCLVGLQGLQYPDYEVILVNDGSDEKVAAIASEFQVQLINTPHGGLSVARNLGLKASRGELVAYIDDDAYPDPHWLQYLAHAFIASDFAAVGGPNIPPATRRLIPNGIANAPGGPVHVLFTDREAEHIPGCNMAFRRDALRAVGGFDPQFRVAGDDVDICWRFHERGLRIGFHPGAAVWHHRRQTVHGYWRQQAGYGRAEAQLERKWPSRYNSAGQPAWSGRIYGAGRPPALIWGRPRVYHGTWGSALFQSIYAPASNQFWSLARMPEWYLVWFVLAAAWLLHPFWQPLEALWPMVLALVAVPVSLAVSSGWRAVVSRSFPPAERARLRALIALLHFIQPVARLSGRLRSGLTPWRQRGGWAFMLPGPRQLTIWSEQWRAPMEWLESIENRLIRSGVSIQRGGPFDRWDLRVRGGIMGSVRMHMLIEEHGAGRQLVRVQSWPHSNLPVLVLFFGSMAGVLISLQQELNDAAMVFGGMAFLWLLVMVKDWGLATAQLYRILRREKRSSEAAPVLSAGPGDKV